MKAHGIAPVPSKSLLRYLRSQNADQHRLGSVLSSRPRSCSRRTACVAEDRMQYMSTATRRPAPHQIHQKDDHLTQQHEPLKALPPPRSLPYPSYQRHASTRVARPQKSGWSHLWSQFRKRPKSRPSPEQQQHPQSYEDASAQLFNLSRALARSPASSDQKLRCTEFDASGNVTLVSGEFKKSELIAKYGLLPRDLRKIDSSILPHILVRPASILLNLLHLRVLIQSDRVLVFDAYGSTNSYTQSLFMYDLEGKLRQKADPRASSAHLPYEFRALEAVLISVTSGLEAEFGLVRDPVTQILRELEEDIDRDKLRHLLIQSKKLGTFEQKARLVRDAIDDLLEADDDLAAMYLSERKRTGEVRADDDHQEIEMLLESYHKICDEIVEISGNLVSNIRNTEEVVRAILDSNRNQLMLLDLKFSIGTLGLAGGTLFAGLYGMNLENFIEETTWGFGFISATSFILSGLIAVYGMRKLRKVQKVRMFGEGFDGLNDSKHIGGRGNWRNEALHSDNQAYYQRLRLLQERGLWQQHGTNTGPGAQPGSGPVLWPGMDGLGMHKLNQTGTSQPDSSYPNSHEQYVFRNHDDVGNTDERNTQDKEKEKVKKPLGTKK